MEDIAKLNHSCRGLVVADIMKAAAVHPLAFAYLSPDLFNAIRATTLFHPNCERPSGGFLHIVSYANFVATLNEPPLWLMARFASISIRVHLITSDDEKLDALIGSGSSASIESVTNPYHASLIRPDDITLENVDLVVGLNIRDVSILSNLCLNRVFAERCGRSDILINTCNRDLINLDDNFYIAAFCRSNTSTLDWLVEIGFVLTSIDYAPFTVLPQNWHYLPQLLSPEVLHYVYLTSANRMHDLFDWLTENVDYLSYTEEDGTRIIDPLPSRSKSARK